MQKKAPSINGKQHTAGSRAAKAEEGRGAKAGGKASPGEDDASGGRTSIQAAHASGDEVAPQAGAEDDLLLWALANGLEPEGGWFRALKLSRRDLAELSVEHRERFKQLQRMEVIGRLLLADQLAVLLKARLAQMLLAASGPKELAEAMRVFEKLPAPAVDSRAGAADTDAPDLELDEGELRETMDEARRLLRELESDPAVRRLLGGTAGRNGEDPQC